jgi:hypothetical protein
MAEKNQQRSTKHTHKTKDRVARTPLNLTIYQLTSNGFACEGYKYNYYVFMAN